MATEKKADKDVEEPERVVDPPEATDTVDTEKRSPRQWVQANQAAILTLPSGASYNFTAGDVELLKPEDVAFMVEQGYGSRTGKPSGE